VSENSAPTPASDPARGLARAATIAFWLVFAGLTVWAILRHGFRGGGDWPIFYNAAVAITDAVNPYAATDGFYLYPPLFAILLTPLVPLGQYAAGAVYAVINAAAAATALWWGAGVVARAFRGNLDAATRPVVALIALLVINKPLFVAMRLGQSDSLIALGLVAALAWAWSGRRLLAGAAVGLTAHVKFHTLGLVPLLAWRRDGRGLLGVVVGIALGVAVGAVVMGPAANANGIATSLGGIAQVLGLSDAPDSSAAPLTFGRSVSIPSTVARALAEEPEEGSDQRYPEVVGLPIILGVTAAAALACFAAGWALYAARGIPLFLRRARTDPHAEPLAWLEWSAMLVGILAFSPQTTSRHTLILIPLALVAAQVLVLPGRPAARITLAVLAVTVAIGTPRDIGGPMIGILAFLFVTLWLGLSRAKEIAAADPGPPTDAPRAAVPPPSPDAG